MEKNKIGKVIQKNLKWVVLIFVILLFLKIADTIFEEQIHFLDNWVYEKIMTVQSQSITNIWKVITELGSAFVILPITFGIFLFCKDKKIGKYVGINLVFIVFLNQIMKFLFQRPRPEGFRLVEESGFSFPSGHSMVSVAFYGFLIYLIYQKIQDKRWKWTLIIGLTIMTICIGISRIYLGVHYASDVIGGFCFSIGYLILYTSILKNKLLDE